MGQEAEPWPVDEEVPRGVRPGEIIAVIPGGRLWETLSCHTRRPVPCGVEAGHRGWKASCQHGALHVCLTQQVCGPAGGGVQRRQSGSGGPGQRDRQRRLRTAIHPFPGPRVSQQFPTLGAAAFIFLF